MSERRKVMVTGGAGSIGTLVVEQLARAGFEVHAVDRRDDRQFGADVTFHRADVKKRSFEDVLKKVRPWALVHNARVRSFEVDAAERHRVNFEGTVHALETALACGVKKIVFPSRHTVYGALPDHPHFLTEDHPPSAGRTFPEIQDLVAADLYVCGMLWRHPEAEIVVLRPVNVLGPSVTTLLSSYLAPRRVFTIAGYDPVYQLLHEADLALAVELSLAPGLKGVFNVSGSGEVPLHVVVEASGARRVPIPEPLIRLTQGRLGFARVPRGAIDFLKFPCTVDGRRFNEATGFSPRHSLEDTLRALRQRRART
jgi:UDP-glucose 4-epimerase